ncbi:MAG: ABC transporter permease [bacterium]
MFHKTKSKGYPGLAVLAIILFWIIASYSVRQPSLALPTPIETVIALGQLLSKGTILLDIAATLYRVVVAFGMALLFGVVTGMLIGINQSVSRSLAVVFDFFRTLPAVVLLPLFLLIFGINDVARIGLAFFVGYWIVGLTVIYGMVHRSTHRIKLARVMKAKESAIFRNVVLYESLPSIFTGAKLAFPVVLIIIITAEMLASPNYGIGVRLIDLQSRFKTPEVYGVTILTGTLGYLASRLLTKLEKRFVHWKTD